MVLLEVPGSSVKVPNSNSEKTILFADDDGQLQKFVAALLQKCGYKVIIASDGRDALEKARVFDGRIDLLLSDVEMPGMTGIELAIQLNQERPDTKILLISGYSEEVARGDIVDTDDFHFLPKPFSLSQLVAKVKDVLKVKE